MIDIIERPLPWTVTLLLLGFQLRWFPLAGGYDHRPAIILKEVLPNLLPYIVASLVGSVSAAVLAG